MAALAVAALSARWLAESARRGGREAIALDIFGDVDTRRAARAWLPIGEASALRIDGARFVGALREVADRCEGWVAGPGFESLGSIAAAAAQCLPLLGNDRETTARVRDPRRFFALLQTLGVAFPEVRWQAPTQPRGWLCKDPTGSGGWHIRRATDAAVPPPGAYFQREIAGLPASALFIADGTRSAILGHNELLVTAHGARPFVYRGAIGPIDLPGTLRVRLQAALDRIVAATALRGLGSFDFVCDGERFYALEINPRPSATMALYDADYPQGLLAAHVAACRRRELPAVRQARAVRAQAIVFAPRTVRVARSEALLALGCRDVPPPGTMVPAGAPLCSVTAAASNAAQVRAELARRADRVIARVESETDERCPTC